MQSAQVKLFLGVSRYPDTITAPEYSFLYILFNAGRICVQRALVVVVQK